MTPSTDRKHRPITPGSGDIVFGGEVANCNKRIVFSQEDIEILGSITPSIRNGEVTAECGLHAKLNWPLIFCEQIVKHGKCPKGFRA